MEGPLYRHNYQFKLTFRSNFLVNLSYPPGIDCVEIIILNDFFRNISPFFTFGWQICILSIF